MLNNQDLKKPFYGDKRKDGEYTRKGEKKSAGRGEAKTSFLEASRREGNGSNKTIMP